ncbi:MAG: ribosomal protein S18-alanine N-acetyltransferase [Nitrospirota bacterium]
MRPIRIREMSPDDIPEIMRIELEAFTTPWTETSFKTELYSRFSLTRVAVLDGAIIGYICVRQIADECHLMDLAVHPGHRQQGVATLLLEDILQDISASECRFLYLEVRMSNQAAKRLYEKFGFRVVGIRKNYYINPSENALVMMRELKQEDTPA